MSQLSDLAAFITADMRQAEELGSHIMRSKELAVELQGALSRVGLDSKAAQVGAIAAELGEASNSRWLTTGTLEDALLVLNGAMTGAYASSESSAAGGTISTTRTNTDGSQSLLGWYQGADVSIRIADSYEPTSNSDSVRSSLGLPRNAPDELDTTGDENVGRFKSFTRKLIRGAADVHAQVKSTASARVDTASAYEPPKHELQEVVGPPSRFAEHEVGQPAATHLDADGIAAAAVVSIVAIDGLARIRRHQGRSNS